MWKHFTSGFVLHKITYDEQPNDHKKKKATSRETKDIPLSISYFQDLEAGRDLPKPKPRFVTIPRII